MSGLVGCRATAACPVCLAAIGAATGVHTDSEMIRVIDAKDAVSVGLLKGVNNAMITTVLTHPSCQPNATPPSVLADALRAVLVSNTDCSGTFGAVTIECALPVSKCLESGSSCRRCLAVLNEATPPNQRKFTAIEEACVAGGGPSAGTSSMLAEVSVCETPIHVDTPLRNVASSALC